MHDKNAFVLRITIVSHGRFVCFFSLSLWNDSVCVFFVLFNWFLWNVRSQMTVTNFEIYSKNQVKRMCNVWQKTAIENKCIFAVIVRISTLQHFYLVLQIDILRLASCKLLCFRFFFAFAFPVYISQFNYTKSINR